MLTSIHGPRTVWFFADGTVFLTFFQILILKLLLLGGIDIPSVLRIRLAFLLRVLLFVVCCHGFRRDAAAESSLSFVVIPEVLFGSFRPIFRRRHGIVIERDVGEGNDRHRAQTAANVDEFGFASRRGIWLMRRRTSSILSPGTGVISRSFCALIFFASLSSVLIRLASSSPIVGAFQRYFSVCLALCEKATEMWRLRWALRKYRRTRWRIRLLRNRSFRFSGQTNARGFKPRAQALLATANLLQYLDDFEYK